jgi:hypothetical protein
VERRLHRYDSSRQWPFVNGVDWAFERSTRDIMLIMEKMRDAAVIATVAAALALVTGCDKGPAQKAGERVDRALDQDRLFGRGPVESAGKKVDKAVDDIKR